MATDEWCNGLRTARHRRDYCYWRRKRYIRVKCVLPRAPLPAPTDPHRSRGSLRYHPPMLIRRFSSPSRRFARNTCTHSQVSVRRVCLFRRNGLYPKTLRQHTFCTRSELVLTTYCRSIILCCTAHRYVRSDISRVEIVQKLPDFTWERLCHFEFGPGPENSITIDTVWRTSLFVLLRRVKENVRKNSSNILVVDGWLSVFRIQIETWTYYVILLFEFILICVFE